MSVFDSWVADVHAKGGRIGNMPAQAGSLQGAPAALYSAEQILRYGLGEADLWTTRKLNGWYLAPATVRAYAALNGIVVKAEAATNIAAMNAAESATDAIEATGLDKGVTGFLGKVFGVPHGVVVAVALVAGAVLGYAALVQVGIVPPLNQLKGK